MEAWGTFSTWVQNAPALTGTAAAGLALALLAVATWRTSLHLGLSLSSDPETGRSLYAWGKLGPLRVQWQKQIGQPTRQTIHFLGMRVRTREGGRSPSRKPPRAEPSKSTKKGRTGQSLRFFLSHWHLREVGAFVWRRRRDFRVHGLEGHIEFGFAEPERTGEVYGALCALTGVIPPLRAEADGSIRTDHLALFPDWSLQDRLTGRIEAGIEIRIVRTAIATLFFFLTHWHPARRHGMLHA